MPNKLDIINNALVPLGSTPVQSLTETQHAVAAGTFWDLTLRATLRAHTWNFAIKRALLAASANAPAYGYTTAFPLPSDWLRTIDVLDTEDFKQEGMAILCSQSAVSLRYVAMIEDPARFDALFTEALAAHLEARLAYAVTQSSAQQQVSWDKYKELLRLARSVDSLEDPPDEFPESSLISMRR